MRQSLSTLATPQFASKEASLGKRRENRVVVSLPVTVTGVDNNGNSFTQTAHTVDVSYTGARLSGVRCLRGAGEMITIVCGSRSARFMVSWVGHSGSSEDGEFGVKCLQPEKRIFRVDGGAPHPDVYQVPPSQAEAPIVSAPAKPEQWDHSERRGHQRFRCAGTAQISQPGVVFPIWARMSDISHGGCYLELIFTMPRLSPVELVLTIDERRIAAKGTVVTSNPGIGVGIRFNSVGEESRRVLNEVISVLAAKRQIRPLQVGANP